MTDLTSSRTREQEAADRIIEVWTCCLAGLGTGMGPGLAETAFNVTRAECARLAADIRGFLPKEGQ